MTDDSGSGDRSKDDSVTTSLDSTFHLIARVRAGDREALERLFARHLPPLQRWARGRLPKWARQLTDTDDLVQDALAQTFKRIDEFEPRDVGALQAYLRQAVINRVRDELRRLGRRPPASSSVSRSAAGGDSPLALAIGRESVERYRRALDRLKPEDRELVIARIEMGYTYVELAEMLGRPSSEAARKAAQRALVRVAEEMQRGKP